MAERPSDVGYLYGYFAELNPLRARLILASAGIACPQFRTACELGFGQGVSANIHAAASPVQWWGTDFSPAQVAFARKLAAASGARIALHDQDFQEFCARPDLPEFDFIGLHGTWTWISDHDRTVIVDFLRRKLRAGGVFYMSYNCLPGWNVMRPMRHLMVEYFEKATESTMPIMQRVEAALEFALNVIRAGSNFAKQNPAVAERMNVHLKHDRAYLAHEFFVQEWHPHHFAEVARCLAPAQLSYICSAHPIDNVDSLNLTTEQAGFLAGIGTPELHETVRDFMTNQLFRRDYWMKEPNFLSASRRTEVFEDLCIMLTVPAKQVPLTVRGQAGETALNPQVYGAVLSALRDYAGRPVGEVLASAGAAGIQYERAKQAVLVLLGMGVIAPAQDVAAAAAARPRTDRLNAALLESSKTGINIQALASPVTGGGVPVGPIERLFLLAHASAQPPESWGAFAVRALAERGEALQKDGRLLDREEAAGELGRQAAGFREQRLPVIEALQIG